MQPSASTPGEAPQPRQSEGKTPVPSRAQQSSARLRGARQHPLPFARRSARLRNCTQPDRGTAHGGGSCGRLQRERGCAPRRWRKKAEWAGLEGMKRKGRGRERERGERELEEGREKGDGSAGSERQEREGPGGYHRNWLGARITPKSPETVSDPELTGQGRQHIKGLLGGCHGHLSPQTPSCLILNRLEPPQFRFKPSWTN